MILISLLRLSSFVLVASRLATALGEEWNYRDKGPTTWGARFSTCRGDRQSPVNIQGEGDWMATEHPLQLDLKNIAIGDSGRIKMENVGTTMRMSLVNSSASPKLSGGDLAHTYTFAQAHFHWGEDNTKGSEHQIDRTVKPMEMHLVHYKASFPSFEAAVAEDEPDSLAVVGVFLEVSSLDHEEDFSETVEKMEEIVKAQSSVVFQPNQTFPFLKDLDLESVYRYQGSLTTPPCSQIIEWIVVERPLKIGREQINKFRELKDQSGRPLVNNFRPVHVWKSKSGASNLSTATSCIILLLLFHLLLM